MEPLPTLGFILIGILAGLLAGLTGVSGGIVTVPALFFIFRAMHFPTETLMHMAIGTSLAAMVFNGISSTYFQHRKKAVIWPLVAKMTPGIILGSFIGALSAAILSGVILELFFGLFACALGLHFLRVFEPIVEEHPLPSTLTLSSIGCGIGALSNILGIGGGVITVPVLVACRVPDKKAIACSAATGLLITLLGALFYLYFGLKHPHPTQSVGYIYMPAFITISIVTFLAAPFGVKLAHVLPPLLVRRIFGCALIATGIVMVLR